MHGSCQHVQIACQPCNPEVSRAPHLMLACEKACAVPLRMSSHCSSSVVVKKLRLPRWLVARSKNW
jgi:hypothetical protein